MHDEQFGVHGLCSTCRDLHPAVMIMPAGNCLMNFLQLYIDRLCTYTPTCQSVNILALDSTYKTVSCIAKQHLAADLSKQQTCI